MQVTDEMIEAFVFAINKAGFVLDRGGVRAGLEAALSVAPTEAGEDDKDLLAIVQDAMRESWTDADEYANAPFFIVDAILHEGFRRLPVPDTEGERP